MANLVLDSARLGLWHRSTDEVEAAIRVVYKYLVCNADLIESDRLISAESQLRDGKN